MAGHSRWANIKRQKAVKDAKKGAAFAKYSRDIITATKLGGPDPAGNFRLRTAIDQGKAAGLTNDTIQRAIDKGSGALAGDSLQEMTYEGYGPGGVAIFIEAQTDNKNRTAGDIRSYFNKYQGNLGADGCVAWIFEERGQILLSVSQAEEDTVMEAAIDAGAVDVATAPSEDDSKVLDVQVLTEPHDINAVCAALQTAGFTVDAAEVLRMPQNQSQVTTLEVAKPLLRLLEAIEDHDDVQAVYSNAVIDPAVEAACG